MNNLNPSEIAAGNYYYTKQGDAYRVTKILVVDGSCLHIRVFRNVFAGPPTIDDIPSLTIMMTMDDLKQGNLNFGVGHAPLDVHGFIETNPILFAIRPVTEDELDGYREWQRQTGL